MIYKKFITAFLIVASLMAYCCRSVFAAEHSDKIRTAIAGLAVGDADRNGEININDATLIQKYIASIIVPDARGRLLSDANYDGTVDIKDVTWVQKIVANIVYSLSGSKGVDISSMNGSVDMNLVKNAGYEFVMIRCGFGDDMEDQDDYRFEENVKKCEELGIPWGVYIYSYALNLKEAQSEVDHVLRLLKGKKPALPVAFDMEDGDGYKQRCGMPSNMMLVNICKTFINGVKNAGYYPALYTNLDWIDTKLTDSELLNSCDIWFAQWSAECQYNGDNIGMWQYGGEVNFLESEKIEGVGVVDKSFCFRDYPYIIKSGHYNNWD